MGVIVATVARNLTLYECRKLKRLVLGSQFHLSNHKTIVLPIKLIHLKHMSVSHRHEIASLVNHPRLAKLKQMFCLIESNLLLKLITRYSVGRGSLDSEKPSSISYSYSDRPSALTTDIPLTNATLRGCHLPIVGRTNQKLPFYL